VQVTQRFEMEYLKCIKMPINRQKTKVKKVSGLLNKTPLALAYQNMPKTLLRHFEILLPQNVIENYMNNVCAL